jgi:hypothetical protein
MCREAIFMIILAPKDHPRIIIRKSITLEKVHGDSFKRLMDQFLPQWRQYREELNRAPLGHEEWEE